MVDVGFDHELVSKLLPLVEVHGVVVCLADGGRGGYWDVTMCWPVWTRGVGIRR